MCGYKVALSWSTTVEAMRGADATPVGYWGCRRRGYKPRGGWWRHAYMYTGTGRCTVRVTGITIVLPGALLVLPTRTSDALRYVPPLLNNPPLTNDLSRSPSLTGSGRLPAPFLFTASCSSLPSYYLCSLLQSALRLLRIAELTRSPVWSFHTSPSPQR